MAADLQTLLRDVEHDNTVAKPAQSIAPTRPDGYRRHVINRAMQERSGRLYCNEEFDFEIPSLELYAAR
jgi:hypothetical protein